MNTRLRLGLRRLLVGGAILSISLIGYHCIRFHPRTAAELYGTYALDCRLVHGDLILHADGTFTQTVTIKATGDVASSKGKWTYDPTHHYLRFRGCFLKLFEWSDELYADYANPPPGWTVIPVERWFGRVVLGDKFGARPAWEKVK